MKKLIYSLIAIWLLLLITSCADKQCNHNWQSATCEKKSTCFLCGEQRGELGEHRWKKASCSAPKTCQLCGTTEGETLEHNWSTLNCTAEKYCLSCKKEGEIKEHSWDTDECLKMPTCTACGMHAPAPEHIWIEADCENAKVCDKCKLTEGDALGHSWSKPTSCLTDKVCSRCKATSSEGLPHKWSFQGCESPRKCTVCLKDEAKNYGHTWIKATCTKAKYCNKCKITDGDPLGHDWLDATCQAPKTCNACKITEGTTKEHNWMAKSEKDTVCASGIFDVSCSFCQETQYYKDYASMGYHTCDDNGKCTKCAYQFDTSKMTLSSVLISNAYSIDKCAIFTSEESSVNIYKSLTTSDIGIPVINLEGDISGITKDIYATVKFTYDSYDKNVDTYAQIKIQGASSAGYPKKNFSVKLVHEDGTKDKVKFVSQWGKENKYCLKANYVDFSQSRNVVSAKIFGEIVRSRNDELYSLPNGGAIDGYPVLVYSNGAYQGLYTFNIPKDNWMFDMSHTDLKNQAILMGETWNDTVAFRALAGGGLELEFASNEDSELDNNTDWVYESINRLIHFVMTNDGEDFKNGIGAYADVDKCIDSMLYTFFICADDNISKNILWVTLDGNVWFSSMYDMDGTWGMKWNGSVEFDENTHKISNLANNTGASYNWKYNLLWEKIYINFFDRVQSRYRELRGSILTMQNISGYFESFFDSIPDILYQAEKSKWTRVPSQNVDHLSKILEYASKIIASMDSILIP